MHTTKPTILFDLDGTLIDSTPAILEGFEAAFLKFNFPFPNSSKITSLIGYPLDVMFENLGVQVELIDDFIAEYKKTYQSIYLQKTILLNRASEAIKFAEMFSDVGVVTTKTSQFSKILLEHLGIAKFIKTIIGKEDVINPKPDAEPIFNALAALNKTGKNAFMVGDTKLDGLAAKNSSIKSVGVTCGYGTADEITQYFDFIVSDAYEAVKFIHKLQ